MPLRARRTLRSISRRTRSSAPLGFGSAGIVIASFGLLVLQAFKLEPQFAYFAVQRAQLAA
jgi:hypothetical protein